MPDPKDPKIFSANDVAVMVEDLKSEFRAVTEMIQPMHSDIIQLKEDISQLKEDMTVVKLGVSALGSDVRSFTHRITKLEAKVPG